MKKFILYYYKRYPDGRVREDSEEIDYSEDNASLLVPYQSRFSAWLMSTRKIDASTLNYPATLGMHLIDFFNSSLSPGEPSREFIGTKEIDEDTRMKMENTMIKFEEHDGKLFRMLEEPTPLTPDAEMPCLVRLIQDDSPMGRSNAFHFSPLLANNHPIIIDTVKDYTKDMSVVFNNIIFYYANFEIVGYPVSDGSNEWALYQVMQGERVCHKKSPSIVYYKHAGGIRREVRHNHVDYMSKDDCWQIYKEPEPQYKVGDWVDCKDLAGVYAQCKVLEIHKHNVILGCKTGHRWSLPHNNIIRKLSPSEIVVRIGCLSGTIEDLSYAEDGRFWFNGGKTERCPVGMHCILYLEMLDTPTRKLVESLLKAQEEEK